MKKKVLVLITLLMLTAGCGNSNYIVNDEKQIVKFEETGQMLQNNILCLPEKDTELYKLYEEHGDQLKFGLDELPACKDFKLNSNKSSSIWQVLFVKPLAYLIIKLGYLVNNMGISVILIGLAIRLILLPFTLKSTKQTQNMKKAQPEIEKIERKYRNRTDNESLMAKSQETMMIYKKYKVSPMLGCLLSFIQLPLFFAFLQAIYCLPVIYEQSLFGFQLGTTPMVGIKAGEYSYLILLILIAVSTYFSFKQTMKQTSGMAGDSGKQMKIMLYVMLVVIVYASINLPTALAFYWIITYAFIALQNVIVDFSTNNPFKKKHKKEDLKKEKIKEKLQKKEGMKYGKDN
ncbi:MAG: YidC/Oxa1 family membrane protein insertase [Bacilli bacterium]